jgi:hypothetical protein
VLGSLIILVVCSRASRSIPFAWLNP